MLVTIDDLKATTLRAIRHYGYTESEAQTILDVLMYAQLRGNNQGIVKLVGHGMPKDPQAGAIRRVKETTISALLDSGRNHGMVVLTQATDLAIEKVRAHGIGIVGMNGNFTSTGAIGYYARRVADAGYLGFVFAGSPEYVAMHGAYEPFFGTNPLAVGIPSTTGTVVFDMATSAIARYGVVEAKTAGRPLPEGVAYDAAGNETTDPSAALAGAIRTFDGYKGAGLAFVVEVLTRSLVETTPNAEGKKVDAGCLVLALDPNLLTDRAAFAEKVASLVQAVKNTAKLPGVEEILVPGERGDRILQAVLEAGQIEVEDNLWAALQQVANA